MAAIYSNGGNRWNILGFNFTKRDALSSAYKISMQGCRSHGGSGSNCPHCPNSAGAARGQQVALFTGTALRNSFVIHRNWNL